MRFFCHGSILPEAHAALLQHEHAWHTAAELGDDAPAGISAEARLLFAMLHKRQWNLLTTDTLLVRRLYEERITFSGTVILLLEGAGAAAELLSGPRQVAGIERLFERYPRLAARRLYTVTPSRVKIRQLPGAGHA